MRNLQQVDEKISSLVEERNLIIHEMSKKTKHTSISSNIKRLEIVEAKIEILRWVKE